jgi:hypothetical protein
MIKSGNIASMELNNLLVNLEEEGNLYEHRKNRIKTC